MYIVDNQSTAKSIARPLCLPLTYLPAPLPPRFFPLSFSSTVTGWLTELILQVGEKSSWLIGSALLDSVQPSYPWRLQAHTTLFLAACQIDTICVTRALRARTQDSAVSVVQHHRQHATCSETKWLLSQCITSN